MIVLPTHVKTEARARILLAATNARVQIISLEQIARTVS